MQRIIVRGARFKSIRPGRIMMVARKIHRVSPSPTVALLNGAGTSVQPTAIVRGGC